MSDIENELRKEKLIKQFSIKQEEQKPFFRFVYEMGYDVHIEYSIIEGLLNMFREQNKNK